MACFKDVLVSHEKTIAAEGQEEGRNKPDNPVHGNAKSGLELFVAMAGYIPSTDQISTDGTGHELTEKMAEKSQFYCEKQGYTDALCHQNEPPAKSNHTLTECKGNDSQYKYRDMEASECSGKLGKIKVFENNPRGGSGNGQTEYQRQVRFS